MSERTPDDGASGVVRRNLRSSASKPVGRAKHETQVSQSEARGVSVEGLTEKQRRFVEAYLGAAKGNGAEAARMAGYQGKDAHTYSVVADRLLASAGIREMISAARSKTASAAIATAEEVQEFLTATMRGTECRSPIVTMAGPVTDPKTGEIMTKPPDAKDRVKAAEVLSKIRGYAAPVKSELEVKGAPIVTVYLPDNGRDP